MVVLFSPLYNKEEQQPGQGLLKSLTTTCPSCGNLIITGPDLGGQAIRSGSYKRPKG